MDWVFRFGRRCAELEQEWRRWWLWAAAGLLAVWLAWALPERLAAEDEGTYLSLEVGLEGNELRVSWQESGGVAEGPVEEATLEVEQDGEEVAVDLREEYQAVGEVTVPVTAREVVVRLRVQRKGQAAVTQTARYTAPGLANRRPLWTSRAG